MDLGYYFLGEGRYGDHYNEAADFISLYRDGLWDCGDQLPVLTANLQRAQAQGKRIVLALDMNWYATHQGPASWDRVLGTVYEKGVAPYAVELADEPDWTEAEAAQWAEAVRKRVAAGVRLGVTLDRNRLNAGVGFYYGTGGGYDYLGIEAYPEPGEAPEKLLTELVEMAPGSVERWVVGQSYDRGGTVGGSVLVDMQLPIAAAARRIRATTLLWFAYGRPGGVVTYRRLVARHREIAEDEGIAGA